ncbi:MAG TPA: hypothetical protein VHY22_09650, partial [Chthoniobacteraceae bacterium]|nr:hypothetical protein [Chthoniobacteraceae bacterium]
MRLLIVDEEIIPGGVETLRRRLIPALAKEVEAIVWVLPAFAVERFRDLAGGNVIIETANTPSGLPHAIEGIARRMGHPRGPLDKRLRLLAKRHRCDVCLATCLLSQPMPRIDIPVAGLVSDVNPGLPMQVVDNIGYWIDRSALTLAVSEFTASELKRMRPSRSDKIHAMPLAVPHDARVTPPARRGSFHYSGAPNPHKGHLTLLKAALGLAARGLDYRLTL